MTKVKFLRKYEFRPCDLCKSAFELYSDSDFVFYVDGEANIYIADNALASEAHLIGATVDDAEEYLLNLIQED